MTIALRARRNADGGFGPYPGRPSTTESTSWAALAFSAEGKSEAADSAIRWLVEHQLDSGAWPHSPGMPEPSWMTSAALLALSEASSARDAVARGARWLLGQRGRTFPFLTRVFYRFWPDRVQVRLDPELRAWPWTEGAFSWCEPTSMAMLALRRLDPRLVPGTLRFRLREGESLLLDRVCSGGGWNYGNSWVLGEDLWPYPDTTALALLALTDRRDDSRVAESLDALQGMLAEHESSLSLSLGVLCLEVFGMDSAPYRRRLDGLWQGEPFNATTRAIALSSLALHERGNPFRPVASDA
ncbi:MAG: prenyltransferase/squalene oxidase repeat-containing protein [Gemmatimonadota bacterium]